MVNPRAIQFMQEKGIDLGVQLSKGLADLPAVTWDYIVTMGCGDACPFVPGVRYIDWDLPDPKGQSIDAVRETRDEIERRVTELRDELGDFSG